MNVPGPLRALADRVRQLQRSYDVPAHPYDLCILAPKRKGCPMPTAEEAGALLMLHVSQPINLSQMVVLSTTCDRNGQRALAGDREKQKEARVGRGRTGGSAIGRRSSVQECTT